MMPSNESWQLCCAELKQRGAYLFQSKIWSDCTFQLDDVTIKAHKLIMAMASPVFSKMLFGSFVKFPMPIDDVRPEVFNLLLEYIYSDNLNIQSSKDACELYYAANKWRIPYVAKCCVKYLLQNMSPNNVCHIYKMACENEDKTLQMTCEKIFSSRTKEVLKVRSFFDIDTATVKKLFSLNSLNIDSELDLFEALVEYAKFHDQKTENKRSIVAYDETPPSKKARHDLEDNEELNDDTNLEESPNNASNQSHDSNQSSADELSHSTVGTGMRAKTKYQDVVSSIRFLTLTPHEFAECTTLSSLLTETDMLSLGMNISSKETVYPLPEGFCRSMVPRTQSTREDRSRLAAVFRSIIHNFKNMQKYESIPFYLRNLAWTFMVIGTAHNNMGEYYWMGVTCFFEDGAPEWVKNTKVKVKFGTHKPVPRHLHKIALRVNESNPEYGAWVSKIKRQDLLNPDYGFVDELNTVTYKLYVNTVPRPNESPDAEELAGLVSDQNSMDDSQNLVLRLPKAHKESVTPSQSVKNTSVTSKTTSASQNLQQTSRKPTQSVTPQPKAFSNVTQAQTNPVPNIDKSKARPGSDPSHSKPESNVIKATPTLEQSQSTIAVTAVTQSRSTTATTQSGPTPAVTAMTQSRPTPSETAMTQSRPTPSETAMTQSRPTPSETALTQSRTTPSETAMTESRPTPAVTAMTQSRPTPSETAMTESRPIPAVTAMTQSRPTPSETAMTESRPTPAVTAMTQSRPTPSETAMTESRPTSAVTAMTQSRPTPSETAMTESRPTSAVTAMTQSRPTPSETAMTESRPTPSGTAMTQSRPTPAVSLPTQSQPSPSMTPPIQSQPSPSIGTPTQSRPSPIVTLPTQSQPSHIVTLPAQSQTSSMTPPTQSRSSPIVAPPAQSRPSHSMIPPTQSRPSPYMIPPSQSRPSPSMTPQTQSRPCSTAAVRRPLLPFPSTQPPPYMVPPTQFRPSPIVAPPAQSRPSHSMIPPTQSRPSPSMTPQTQSRPFSTAAVHRPLLPFPSTQQRLMSATANALQSSQFIPNRISSYVPQDAIRRLSRFGLTPSTIARLTQMGLSSKIICIFSEFGLNPRMVSLLAQWHISSNTIARLNQVIPSRLITRLCQSGLPAPEIHRRLSQTGMSYDEILPYLLESRRTNARYAVETSKALPNSHVIVKTIPSPSDPIERPMTATPSEIIQPNLAISEDKSLDELDSKKLTASGECIQSKQAVLTSDSIDKAPSESCVAETDSSSVLLSSTSPKLTQPSTVSSSTDQPILEHSLSLKTPALSTVAKSTTMDIPKSESSTAATALTSDTLPSTTILFESISVDPLPNVSTNDGSPDLSQETITKSFPSLPKTTKRKSYPLHAVTLPWPPKRLRSVSEAVVSLRSPSELDETKPANVSTQFFQPKSLQTIAFNHVTSGLPWNQASMPITFDSITVDPPPIVPTNEESPDLPQETITISIPSVYKTTKRTSSPLHALPLPWPKKRTLTVSDALVTLRSESDFDEMDIKDKNKPETIKEVFQPKPLQTITFAEVIFQFRKFAVDATLTQKGDPELAEDEDLTLVQPLKLLALHKLAMEMKQK